MSIDQILAYLTFSVVAAITPGPANVLVAATSAQVGIRRGLPCLLGVAVGTGLLLGAVALGFGSVLLEQPQLLNAMKFGGAILLLWLAWKIATAPPIKSQDEAASKPVGFTWAAGLQWINPKSWIVAVSAAGTYLSADSTNALAQATMFAVFFTAAAIPAIGVWLVAGAGFRRLLSTRRSSQIFNWCMGLLLAASVALMFV